MTKDKELLVLKIFAFAPDAKREKNPVSGTKAIIEKLRTKASESMYITKIEFGAKGLVRYIDVAKANGELLRFRVERGALDLPVFWPAPPHKLATKLFKAVREIEKMSGKLNVILK